MVGLLEGCGAAARTDGRRAVFNTFRAAAGQQETLGRDLALLSSAGVVAQASACVLRFRFSLVKLG